MSLDVNRSESIITNDFCRFKLKFSRLSKSNLQSAEDKIEDLIGKAGQTFHRHHAEFNSMHAPFPIWFNDKPTGKFHASGTAEGSLLDHEYWGTYWWCVVVWMAKNIPESAIFLPTCRISSLIPKSSFVWIDLRDYLYRNSNGRESQIYLRKLWKEIACLSSELSAYLCESVQLQNKRTMWSPWMQRKKIAAKLELSLKGLNSLVKKKKYEIETHSQKMHRIRLDVLNDIEQEKFKPSN